MDNKYDMSNRSDNTSRTNAHTDAEFRGSTTQALVDLRDDIIDLKKLSTDNAKEMQLRFENLINQMALQSERYEQKFVQQKDVALLFQQVERNSRDIETLKGWRIYLVGVFAAVMALIIFFGEQIRKLIFGG